MLDYESALVEEAVLLGLRGHPEEKAFRRERDRLYGVPDPEAREAVFRNLHAAWFETLGLGRPIAQAFREQPSVAAATRGCRIAAARSRQEEGAELFVRPHGPGLSDRDRRWVVIRLRPEALGSAEALLQFLRHELFHIADMLDPCFGYEPSLRREAAELTPERLLRDRYRVLWDATIDGRLARLGLASSSFRAARFHDFVRTFPRLGAGAEEAFSRFFDGATRAHADLVAFAANPGGGLATRAEGFHPGERCPLCRFPTHAFEADPSGLPAEALERVRADFPAWDPLQGLCEQCAELYRARAFPVSGAARGGPPLGICVTRHGGDPESRSSPPGSPPRNSP